MEDNMKLWNQVCKSDPKSLKWLPHLKLTAIAAGYQKRQATRMFGPFGIGWGVDNPSWAIETIEKITVCVFFGTLWYHYNGSRGEFPISSTIELFTLKEHKFVGDYTKKAMTDAVTKGLSELGFNADVFCGEKDGKQSGGNDNHNKFYDNKYYQKNYSYTNTTPQKPNPSFLDASKKVLDSAIKNLGWNNDKDDQYKDTINKLKIKSVDELKTVDDINKAVDMMRSIYGNNLKRFDKQIAIADPDFVSKMKDELNIKGDKISYSDKKKLFLALGGKI